MDLKSSVLQVRIQVLFWKSLLRVGCGNAAIPRIREHLTPGFKILRRLRNIPDSEEIHKVAVDDEQPFFILCFFSHSGGAENGKRTGRQRNSRCHRNCHLSLRPAAICRSLITNTSRLSISMETISSPYTGYSLFDKMAAISMSAN